MKPAPFVIDLPWDAWPTRAARDLNAAESCQAAFGPRILAGIHERPIYGSDRRHRLPWASFPFRHQGHDLVAFRLPWNAQEGTHARTQQGQLSIAEREWELAVEGVPGRPSADDTESDGGRLLKHCEWQVHGFQELIERSSIDQGPVVRCAWNHVFEVWHRPDHKEPRMALIVKLARDASLRRLLRSVALVPRRVLMREREMMSVSRIQQLDAHCIRDYVRRPGRTPAEKAGPRQELLGVRRRETCWTLENRVASWTLARMCVRASAYRLQNRDFPVSRGTRVGDVRICEHEIQDLLAKGELGEADPTGLHHPVPPNYSLQMDPRYRRIHQVYLQLQHEKKVLDEAWTWQQALWSDSVRQLVYSDLYKRLLPLFESPVYLRREADRGTWSAAPLAPGPFETRSGELYVLDPEDVQTNLRAWFESGFPFREDLGAVGADFALWWPKQPLLIAFWAMLGVASDREPDALLRDAAESLSRLRAAIQAASGERYELRGMLFVATTAVPEDESAGPDQVEVEGARVVGVRYGVGGSRGLRLQDFHSALELVAEPHLSR